MLDRLFGRTPRGPWGDAPSIFRHVSRHIRRSGPGLKAGGERLPDESTGPEMSFPVAGGHDGLLIHHLGVEENPLLASDIYHALRQVLLIPSEIAQARLYELINEGGALQYVDQVLETILEQRELDPDDLLQLARWWAREAPDRQAVKFAVALLGLFNEDQDLELLMKLGRHEEFTLFAAVAISNSREESGDLLWELARNVEGWGRIHAVELLAENPTPAVRPWLLREGYRNSILYEYLAGVCARAGDLAGALRAAEVDGELLDAAVEIVDALFHVPGDELERYAEAGEAVSLLLSHLQRSPLRISHLICVYGIHRELNNSEADWSGRERNGWNRALREEQLELCESILFRAEWKDLALSALAKASDADLATALTACEIVGIDTYAHHLARLVAEPYSLERWEACLERATPRRLRALLVLAERAFFGSRQLGGGVSPADPKTGLAVVETDDFHREACLEALFVELRTVPGRGFRLLTAVLEEDSESLRRAALEVLDAWGYEDWPTGVLEALRAARLSENESDLCAAMDRMIGGGAFSDPDSGRDDDELIGNADEFY